MHECWAFFPMDVSFDNTDSITQIDPKYKTFLCFGRNYIKYFWTRTDDGIVYPSIWPKQYIVYHEISPKRRIF